MKLIHTLLLLACTSAGAADAIPPRATAQPVAAPPPKPGVQKGEMAGYLLVPNEKVPNTFNAGFSMYVAAWPLVKTYPGSCFQETRNPLLPPDARHAAAADAVGTVEFKPH